MVPKPTPIIVDKNKVSQLINYIKSILNEINETNNFDLLNKCLYGNITNLCEAAFGKCRADFINLNMVDGFLNNNGGTLDYVDKTFKLYNQLRNKFGSFKIIKYSVDKPDDYKNLTKHNQNIYDEYQIINNKYYELFFKNRDNITKNIVNDYDKYHSTYKKDNLYVIIHHKLEIYKNYNKGGLVKNLSDMNVVLDKQFHSKQLAKGLLRCDLYIHTFLHLICSYVNKYGKLNLFQAINELIKVKENELKITENEFKNSSIRNYFTDYQEFQYMLNMYGVNDLQLLASVINKLKNKIKQEQRINNER